METPNNNDLVQILLAERVDKKNRKTDSAEQFRIVEQTRLRATVRFIRGNECQVRLHDNNGFDRDDREVLVPLDMVKPLDMSDNVKYHSQFGIGVQMKGNDKRLGGKTIDRVNWNS